MVMDERLLQDIGLTNGESKVYLALLNLGETKTGELAKKSQVSSSKIYKILDRLEKKGIVVSNKIYPKDWNPDYNQWKNTFEKNKIDENIICENNIIYFSTGQTLRCFVFNV